MLHAAGNDMIAGSQSPCRHILMASVILAVKTIRSRSGALKFCQGLTGVINNPPGLYSQPVPGAAGWPHPL